MNLFQKGLTLYCSYTIIRKIKHLEVLIMCDVIKKIFKVVGILVAIAGAVAFIIS